jgi:hypothetical protein
MGGVVVQDQVKFAPGDRSPRPVSRTARTLEALAGDFRDGDLQRRKQGGGAVSDGIVGVPLDLARTRRHIVKYL